VSLSLLDRKPDIRSGLEPLTDTLSRGDTPAQWLGREQVKLWTLEERAGHTLQDLYRDPEVGPLIAAVKAAAGARGPGRGAAFAPHRRSTLALLEGRALDEQLAKATAERDAHPGWKAYLAQIVQIAQRREAMRVMWEERHIR
jgi:hypothetical protein